MWPSYNIHITSNVIVQWELVCLALSYFVGVILFESFLNNCLTKVITCVAHTHIYTYKHRKKYTEVQTNKQTNRRRSKKQTGKFCLSANN